MKASEGQAGRIFVLRLEDDDVVPHCIEQFAAEKKVWLAQVILLGGVANGQIVVGPRRSDEIPPDPMVLPVDAAHEVVAVGIMATGPDGKPNLHMHGALGRSGQTVTGCLRMGVKTWLIGEAVVIEIAGARAARVKDPASGFALLEPGTC